MKTDDTFVLNFFIALLFVFINPLYAVSICAVLNFMNYRINFWLFSIMFASSFGLFFFMRNWNVGNDALYYLRLFQAADSYFLTDIFFHIDTSWSGMQPFWKFYLWISRFIIGDHVDFFAFFNLFTIFLVTAYLGQVVDEKRFIVVIVCILFVSGGFFSNVYQVWRHTFALLFFFIGIFWFEADRDRRYARGLMYSSALFHVVSVPLVAAYEVFTFYGKINAGSKRNAPFQTIRRYSIQAVAYAVLAFFTLKFFEGINLEFTTLAAYSVYTKEIEDAQSGYDFLIHPLTVAIIVYFWFNRKEISKNDVFIGINYFLLLGAFMKLDIPSQAIGRAFHFFLVGVSIISAKLVLKDKKYGFLYLVTIIMFMFYTLIRHGGGTLSYLVGEQYLNPVYGLVGMLLNYSEFLVPPSALL